MRRRKIETLIDQIPDAECDQALIVASLAQRMHKQIAGKLHISDKALKEILNGEREVSHIVYHQIRNHYRRTIAKTTKYIGLTAMAALLVLCLTVEGFADGVRHGFLNIFARPESTRVQSIDYQRSINELTGLLLPTHLLDGYRYATHTRPTDSDMLHVLYLNDRGEKIEYYYYPDGAFASYDNEYTQFYDLPFSMGTLHVGRTDTGFTFVYCMYGEAYIQMEFETHVTDQELIRIVNDLRRLQ